MATVAQILAGAQPGPLVETSVIAVNGTGTLRVTYNWLYSALNCDPTDHSPFAWVLTKLDDVHVTLSPREQYHGRTLYASVRDDYRWTVQVQAPFSADWITAVGGDERLTMQGQDLLIASFLGFNGQYVAVDGSATSHDGHSGHLLHSVGAQDPRARMWFLGVTAVRQEGLDVPLAADLTPRDVGSALEASGLDDSQEAIQTLISSVQAD